MTGIARGVLVAGLLAGALAAGFSEPLALIAKAWRGGRAGCPLHRVVDARQHAAGLRMAKDRILAASRLLRRDTAGHELWETPRGRFWIPPGNQYTLPFNLAEQELRIYHSPAVHVRPGDVVLDCGANVGTFVRTALRAGAALVVAIEPLPVNIACLRRNFATEILHGRVIVYPKGVWRREATLTLYVDPKVTAAASLIMGKGKRKEAVRVPLTTIDRLAGDLSLRRVDFIKMDIEGAETAALEGAAELLRRFRPRLAISAYHLDDDPKTIPAAVARAQPDYQMECGACEELPGRIRPIVLFFR